MPRLAVVALLLLLAGLAPTAGAQPPSTDGPYRVLTRARVGGEGGTDYLYANPVDRRLYITRNAVRAVAATDSTPARPAVPGRVTVFSLETLAPLGEILNGGGNGAVVDAARGHGFASSHPNISMFDTRSLQLLTTIDGNVGNPPPNPQFSPDGIYFDPSDERVYIGSHPTKDLLVLDGRDGAVVGKIALGGVPEQTVSDGQGTLYAILQDSAGQVAVVNERTLRTTAHYALGDIGRCNGLALDALHHILFAACAQGRTAGQPPQPVMVILRATDGTILTTLPLAGSSDGAVYNPQTREAFSAHGNGTLTVIREVSPTQFVVVENLPTMPGARTLTLDPTTGHVFVMSVERGPVPPPPPAGSAGVGSAPGAGPPGGGPPSGGPPGGGPPGGGRGPQAPAIPGSFTIVMIGK